MSNLWNFSIISINVNGIASNMWHKLRKLHKAKYDVVLLQETKLKGADLNDNLIYRWQQITDGAAYVSPAASAQAGGVAILLSAYACSILKDRDQLPITSDGHRQIIVSASLFGQTVYLQSIYAPARRAERPEFFNRITNPSTPGSHIIGGDFNCVPDANLDTTGDATLATTGTPEFLSWMATLDAIDAWRTRHDSTKEFTSPGGGSRIDLILLSGCFKNNFTANHSPRIIGSDHLAPRVVTHSCDITAKGGHWQLPTWLAGKAANHIKPILEKLTTSTDDPNYPLVFTKTMKDISGKCMALHKSVLRWRKDKVDRAKLRWLRAHQKAIANPTSTNVHDAEVTRSEWIKATNNESDLRRARAFDKHYAEAERCTAYFLRRPRKKNVSIIPGVRVPDGSVNSDPDVIRTHHNSYWSNLYSFNSNGAEQTLTDNNINTLTNIPLPRLPQQIAAKLEEPVTEEDIVTQIAKLPNNKAAGADGLRAELLKQSPKLWGKVLRPIFEDVLHQHNQLPQPFRESVIILLHKKGCALLPKNYRPIALLNVIAKVLSGIHNDRLRHALDHVIPPEQTGFIPKRSISENIILLQDSIHYAKSHHPSAVILALDFEKAYDRVQWRVMMAVLENLNFGPRWRHVIATMYTQRSARLSINGDLSNPFPIERGVLQGDPLSPALFILQCSPLYSKLNSLKTAHGIPLPDNNVAPVATFYADDTNIIAKSPASAVALYNTAAWFCEHSGARIHPDKCVAIATGPAPPRLSNGIRILEPSQDTTILGVPMGLNISRHQQTQRVVAKMIGKCSNLAHIGRTIEGRVTIARAMILSTVWYVLGALPTDPSESKKIQTLIYNYLNGCSEFEWDGPAVRGNIARQWYHRTRKEGGWNLPPVTRTLRARKLAMVKAFLVDEGKGVTKPWHTYIRVMLRKHLQNWGKSWRDILWWNGTQKEGEFSIGNWEALSPWWREAWKEWLKLRCTPQRNSFSRNELRTWPIWNNRVLAINHGTNDVLYRTFTNSSTRAHMSEIRRLGFLCFDDFIGNDDTVMNGAELHTAVTVRASVYDATHVVPQPACESLCRIVQALWSNVLKNWLRLSAYHSPHNTTRWSPAMRPNTSFTAASNSTITSLIAAAEPKVPQPKLIRLFNHQAIMNWSRERISLRQLAPTRRDLLLRLVRNALPLGFKRKHWTTHCQTMCMLCDTNTLETAKHTFWDCAFAKETWNGLQLPWRNQARAAVTWKEVLVGHEVRGANLDNTRAEQLWSIVRGCVTRTVWLERNRRYFYPELPRRSARFRHNQAVDDIRAHVHAWHRRSDDDVRPLISAAIDHLANRAGAYFTVHINPADALSNSTVPADTPTHPHTLLPP